MSWIEEWFPPECTKCMKFGKECKCKEKKEVGYND
jgi:hypothetical protein